MAIHSHGFSIMIQCLDSSVSCICKYLVWVVGILCRIKFLKHGRDLTSVKIIIFKWVLSTLLWEYQGLNPIGPHLLLCTPPPLRDAIFNSLLSPSAHVVSLLSALIHPSRMNRGYHIHHIYVLSLYNMQMLWRNK